MTTIEAAIDAVRELCFGWLPVYRIQSHLQTEELLPVHMPVGGTGGDLNIICKDLNPGSRELSAMAELLGINRDLEWI